MGPAFTESRSPKIGDAENILFESMNHHKLIYMKTAIDFYDKINQLSAVTDGTINRSCDKASKAAKIHSSIIRATEWVYDRRKNDNYARILKRALEDASRIKNVDLQAMEEHLSK